MPADKYTRADFDYGPLVVFYETTQACDLVCQHCRACAQPRRDPRELDTAQARQLIAQLCTFPKPPMLVLTGGDPLKRPDICELVEHGIKTTEAPHYRRYVLQRKGNPQRSPNPSGAAQKQRAPLGINDGKGIMFVNHKGAIFPSGFLPLVCGQFPTDSVVDVYQNSRWFRKLREVNQLQGKCGACEFRHVCGGSRARACAVTGDPLAAEPDCAYIPARLREEEKLVSV
jgi:radical SAM protein with 4Fe4S-binding SPASM domain